MTDERAYRGFGPVGEPDAAGRTLKIFCRNFLLRVWDEYIRG